jgi:uncharacterized protein involved in exopolysaccharide biosynthesis
MPRHLEATPLQTEAGGVSDRARSLWRRRRLILWVGGVAAMLTLLLSLLLPPTYKASATILIEQQEIPQELVRSTITSYADQRVQVLSQRVMTTQNMLGVIDRYGLYPDLRKRAPREELLSKIREDVELNMIGADVIDPRSGRPTRANIAFTVSYSSRSPELAFKVANELTSLYLNENVESRMKQVQQAAGFLGEESNRLSGEIASLENHLADFKRKYADQLPELKQFNIASAERTGMDERDAMNRLAMLDQQKTLLDAQLAQTSPVSSVFAESGQRVLSAEDRLRALRGSLASLTSRYGPNHPDVLSTRREVEGLEKQVHADSERNDLFRQLEDAQSQLGAARQRYSPDHPDVKRLDRLVAGTQQALKDAPKLGSSAALTANKPDNPVYIQLKGQIDALATERDSVKRQLGGLRGRLSNFEKRLTLSPEVERQYAALARDYENARSKYQEVRAKQMEAQVAQNLEAERKGERFTLIDPALPPERPVSPNRPVILILGLVLSLAAAAAAALIADALDSSVRSASDLRRLLGVDPLVTLPLMVTSAELLQRRERWRRAFIAVAVSVPVFLLLVHLFFMPLDVLLIVLARRFGM